MHIRLALCGRALFDVGLRETQTLALDHVILENEDRVGDLADLVVALGAEDLSVHAAAREIENAHLDALDRTGEAGEHDEHTADRREQRHRADHEDAVDDADADSLGIGGIRLDVLFVALGEAAQLLVEGLSVGAVVVVVAEGAGGRDGLVLGKARELGAKGDEFGDILAGLGESCGLGVQNLPGPELGDLIELLRVAGNPLGVGFRAVPVARHVDAARIHHDRIDEAVDALEIGLPGLGLHREPLGRGLVAQAHIGECRAQHRQQPKENDEAQNLVLQFHIGQHG